MKQANRKYGLLLGLVTLMMASAVQAQEDRDGPSKTVIITAPVDHGAMIASYEGEEIEFRFEKWVCNADKLADIYRELTAPEPFPGIKERVEYCRKRHARGAEFSLCVTSGQPDTLLKTSLVSGISFGLKAPQKVTQKGCYTWDNLQTVRKVLLDAASKIK
jgi:hypothetical protein